MHFPNYVQLYRLVWLYSAVHGLAAVCSPADHASSWPEVWRLALGRIAAATPPLLPRGPPEAATARLDAELGERLLRLGSLGTGTALAGARLLRVKPSSNLFKVPVRERLCDDRRIDV